MIKQSNSYSHPYEKNLNYYNYCSHQLPMKSEDRPIPVSRITNSESDIIKELICAKCQNLPSSYPKMCVGCQKFICNLCQNDFYGCPHCKMSSFTPIPKISKMMYDKLCIRCPNYHHGCNQSLKYLKMEEHVQKCKFQVEVCEGCSKEILKTNIIFHKSQCGGIIITCSHCQKKIKRNQMGEHDCIDSMQEQIKFLNHSHKEIIEKIEKIKDTQ